MSAAYKNIIRDHKLSHRLNPVFTIAPELELACSRLADFIGERFMGDKRSLAAEMIKSALDGYKRVKRTGDPHIAFMQGLFEPAKLLYARRYAGRRKDKLVVWCPMVEAIPQFEARYHDYAFEMVEERCPDHITQRTAAFQMAARVLHGEAFRRYFEEYDVAHRYDHSEALGG
ncbi:hypothetical protein BVER_03543 [Candidatus Burkholderia verschuerenii]|uniref:Uncharacterized protein n=1 Tax=Candidatus Burkholderia verschuerenii TaxID=242163 RepID=A0A0L0M605_9BURK|nr:hypothetical protein [Candidatus Burkholderia verschuerenii]KND57720.1 hypothetical protein BVER_03543 [Candidatus Burkholderia verschuerenii]